MIAAVIVAALAALSLCAWVVILPPRERNGFEEHDWREHNFPAAEGAAEDGQGTGGAAVVGKRASSSAAAD